MIVLGEDEKIETLALGDSIAWKVEPNKRGNIIFVKPVEKNAFSNLNVVTSKRIYSFILRADFRQGRTQVFKVRFRFPEDEADAKLIAIAKERARYPNTKNFNVANANSDYAYKGSSLSKPTAGLRRRRQNLVSLRARSGNASNLRRRPRPQGKRRQFP